MHSYILNHFQSNSEIFNQINILCHLNLPLEKYLNSPDVIILKPEINEKTVNKTASIKIEHIRQLQSRLTKSPLTLPVQIAIIFQAETITIPAQNSFLKLLEEPGPKTHIFLITQNHQALLKTILSRCQIINSNEFIKATEVSLETQALFEKIQKSNSIQRLLLIEPYQKSKANSQILLLEFINIVRNNLRIENKSTSLNLLHNLVNAYQDLDQNLNLKLCLDYLILNWDKRAKPTSF